MPDGSGSMSLKGRCCGSAAVWNRPKKMTSDSPGKYVKMMIIMGTAIPMSFECAVAATPLVVDDHRGS